MSSHEIQEGKKIYDESDNPREGITNVFDQYWATLNVQPGELITTVEIKTAIDSLGGDSSQIQPGQRIDDTIINNALASTIQSGEYAGALPGGDGSLDDVVLPAGTHTLNTDQIYQYNNLTLQDGAVIQQSGTGNRLAILVKDTLTLEGSATIEWYSPPGSNGGNGGTGGERGSDGNDGQAGNSGGSGYFRLDISTTKRI